MDFKWNEVKNAKNIAKHSLPFYIAQEAFLDENRVIILDKKHSSKKSYAFVLVK